MIVDTRLVDRLHRRCVVLLNEGSRVRGPGLRLESTEYLSIIAWKIIWPLFVAITGGVVTVIVTRRRSKRMVKDLKKEVNRLVGKKVVELSEQRKEECVILIHDLLSPFGLSREEARNVFTVLIDEAYGKDPKDEPASG